MTSSATLLHELRTPLAASSFALDVIERTPEYSADERAQQALRTLRLAITEAIRVVQWWGEAQERGQMRSHIRPVPVEAALRHAIALVPHLSRLPHVDVAEDTPLALADELLLNRVFVNLIENAFRHGRQGGALDITTTAANGFVHVRFLNEGVIPESALKQIVGSAQKSASPSGNHTHGYGLGIVKALVNDMHGDVTVDSDWRHWTAFTVTLPAAHPESASRN
jgi:signal transduction histidine kinase